MHRPPMQSHSYWINCAYAWADWLQSELHVFKSAEQHKMNQQSKKYQNYFFNLRALYCKIPELTGDYISSSMYSGKGKSQASLTTSGG